MKKTFLGLFLCVIVFLAPVSLSYTQSNGSVAQKMESRVLVASAQGTPSGSTSTNAPAENKSSLVGAMLEVPKIGFWNSVSLWFGNTILSVASMFTYVGGKSLDMSLTTTVFEMGKHINNVDGNLGNKINDTWKIIRDICNLAFIFGFVYIGIRTIIDPESASTKRFLSKIIIGALLINFSLFFVKFIVDFSNFTAYHIYNAMVSGEGSLSATVADMLGIVSIFKAPDPIQFAQITGGGMFWFFVLGAILLLVVAFVFFAAAIHLVVRFVALILIMVGSPILFAATVFPQTEHYASDMWKKLISYSFFAPAFLLLLLISLTLVQGLGTAIVPPGSSFVDAMKRGSGDAGAAIGSMGIILNFVITIFFFIQSLIIAQKMGVASGDAAVSIGNKIRGNVQSAIGRNTVGRAGDWSSKKIQDMRENPNSRTARLTGGLLHATVGGVADSAKGAKFGGSMSRTDAKKDNEALATARSKNAQVGNISKSITETVTTHASGSTATQAQKDETRIKMEQAVAGASTEQLQDLLKEHKDNPETFRELVGNMSASQFESLMKLKPEDLDDTKKAALKNARASSVSSRLISNSPVAGASLPDVISKADGKDLDALNFTDVYNNAGLLNSKQIDDMSLTTTAKARLKAKRNDDLIDSFRSAGAVSARATFDHFKDAEAAKLPKEILTDPLAAEHLNVNILNKILDNDSLTATDRTKIKTNVLTHHGSAGTSTPYTSFFSTPAGSRY